MNCPTVALIDSKFRLNLEETGTGYAREIDVLGYASSQGLFTKAFCTTPEETLAIAEADVDNRMIYFGNSSGGTIGPEKVMNYDDAAQRAALCTDVLSDKYGDRIITCHGGAIEKSEHFAEFIKLAPQLHGYVGSSSAERFPIEDSVPAVTRGFKAVPTGGA